MKIQMDIAKLRLLNQQLVRSCFDIPQDIVRWMGAIQGQDIVMCQWAIGVRMKKPDRQRVLTALNEGDIIRMHLNRSTWQVVVKEDVRWMLSLHGEKSLRAWRNFAASTGLPLTDKMIDDSRDLLQKTLCNGNYLSREDLMQLYQTIDVKNANIVRHLLAVAEGEGLVCSGPIEGRGVTYALLEERVRGTSSLSKESALAELAIRYFQSHAPATFGDFVWWSGLSVKECRVGMEQIQKDLEEVSVDGNTYYVYQGMQEGRLPKDLVRLLPPYDELLIGYKDRTAVLPKEFERKAYNRNGVFFPIILHQKQITGNWSRKDMTCNFFQDVIPTDEVLNKALLCYKGYDRK